MLFRCEYRGQEILCLWQPGLLTATVGMRRSLSQDGRNLFMADACCARPLRMAPMASGEGTVSETGEPLSYRKA